MQLGYNGFGFPDTMFNYVVRIIREKIPDLLCTKSAGMLCYTNTTCQAVSDNMTDYYFNVTFATS